MKLAHVIYFSMTDKSGHRIMLNFWYWWMNKIAELCNFISYTTSFVETLQILLINNNHLEKAIIFLFDDLFISWKPHFKN